MYLLSLFQPNNGRSSMPGPYAPRPPDESLAVVDVIPRGSNDDYVESLTHRCRIARRPDHPFGVDPTIMQSRGQERFVFIPVRKSRARG